MIRKSTFDCFTNPALEPLLGRLGADTYVVYGVVTEICVQCAAMGLLRTGARVLLVTDAIQSLDAGKAAAFFDAFSAQGGKLTTAAEVCVMYHGPDMISRRNALRGLMGMFRTAPWLSSQDGADQLEDPLYGAHQCVRLP